MKTISKDTSLLLVSSIWNEENYFNRWFLNQIWRVVFDWKGAKRKNIDKYFVLSTIFNEQTCTNLKILNISNLLSQLLQK